MDDWGIVYIPHPPYADDHRSSSARFYSLRIGQSTLQISRLRINTSIRRIYEKPDIALEHDSR
jgi:hypothetical protein